MTLRASLNQAGIQAKSPNLPIAGRHVFEWFVDLCQSRPSSGFGASGIPYTEIAAWCDLTGVFLQEWELKAIRAMDAAFLKGIEKHG